MDSNKTVAVRIGETIGTALVGVVGVLILSGAAYVVLAAWRVMGFIGG